MTGLGIDSPYDFRPIVGYRLAMDTFLQVPVKMYNPHMYSVLVKEMSTRSLFVSAPTPTTSHSSYSDSLLELTAPEGQATPSAKSWELLPFQTRIIGNLQYTARKPIHIQGFVYVRFSHLVPPDYSLPNPGISSAALHVDIDVPDGTVWPIAASIDFGTMITLDQSSSKHVRLLNASPRNVVVLDVQTQSPDSQMRIQFQRDTVLGPHEERDVRCFSLLYAYVLFFFLIEHRKNSGCLVDIRWS